MPRLPRVTAKIFASNAQETDIGQYGSALTGTKVTTGDIAEIQALPAYEVGWRAAVTSDRNYPTLQEMNGLQKTFSQQIKYDLDIGMPEWDENTTYYQNYFCQVNGTFYKSLTDDNKNHNPLTDTANWEVWSAGNSGGGLEVCDIGLSLYVDETKGLRRYLNGQIIAITEHTQAFLNRLKQIIALYPTLLTTEENWQAAKTLSHLGQVGKFVIDEEAATIRLPRVVNIQGLFDLQNLGLTVAAGLPNITAGMGGFLRTHAPNFTVSGAYSSSTVSAQKLPSASGNVDSVVSLNFDASDSNPIYDNSDTVQEEAIQYPFYIQIATGQETEVNIINDIELNNPYTLFDSKYSDSELFNTSWLISNNTYHSGTTYITAYEALQVEYNTQVEAGTKVTLPSGTDYTKRGLSVKLPTESYTDYDFVLNTADSTFRFPTKTKFSDNSVTGLFLYYYVGETVQNANLINAGRLGEQIANVIPNNSELIASYVAPSDKVIPLTLGNSGTPYTAPSAGYYILTVSLSTNGYANIFKTMTDTTTQGTKTVNLLFLNAAPNANAYTGGSVYVDKGDVITIGYAGLNNTVFFGFVPTKGVK